MRTPLDECDTNRSTGSSALQNNVETFSFYFVTCFQFCSFMHRTQFALTCMHANLAETFTP